MSEAIKTVSNCKSCCVAQAAKSDGAAAPAPASGETKAMTPKEKKAAGSSEMTPKERNATWGRLKTAVLSAPDTEAGNAARQQYELLTGPDSKGITGRRIRMNKLRDAWLEGVNAKEVLHILNHIFFSSSCLGNLAGPL